MNLLFYHLLLGRQKNICYFDTLTIVIYITGRLSDVRQNNIILSKLPPVKRTEAIIKLIVCDYYRKQCQIVISK